MNEQILEYFKNDRFAAHNGIKLVKAEPGWAVTEIDVTEIHMNALNMIQGGVIFTLGDFAFAAASNAAGQVTVGINAHISYFKESKGKKLIAEAKEVSSSNKLTNYHVNVYNEHKELIAQLQFTGYRKKTSLSFA